MTKKYTRGDAVSWAYNNQKVHGHVQHISRSRTEIQSNGSTVSRIGCESDPALTIKLSDGTRVLKLTSELI